MRIAFVRKDPEEIDFGIIYGVITLLGLTAAATLPVRRLLPACVFKTATDLPCPTCGATRAIVHLTEGSIAAAFSMNPLVALAVIASVGYFLYSTASRMFGLPRPRIVLRSNRERTLVRIGAVLIVAANWLYLLLYL